MPFIESEHPEDIAKFDDGTGLNLLILVDPRCLTLPLHPTGFDSWGTVYCYFITQQLTDMGAYCELESVDEAMSGTFSRINSKQAFDHAIIIVNRASSIYGQILFDNISNKLVDGGKIFTVDDHDTGIVYEDFRFCATVVEKDLNSDRKYQIHWGVDKDIFNLGDRDDTLRVLLDTWHFEERKWDRTREILESALTDLKMVDLDQFGKKSIDVVAWSENGPVSFVEISDIKKLQRMPPRVGFGELASMLSTTDIFMVTHSESMGLTILEAAMSGCLVAIPVPDEGDREFGHFIKPDLCATIPHFRYKMGKGDVKPPWTEMLDQIDHHGIREGCISQTWNLVARKMISALIEHKSSTDVDFNESESNEERVFSERNKMLYTVSMTSKDKKNSRDFGNYILHWLPDKNLSDAQRDVFIRMLEDILKTEDGPHNIGPEWLNGYCTELVCDILDFEEGLFSILRNLLDSESFQLALMRMGDNSKRGMADLPHLIKCIEVISLNYPETKNRKEVTRAELLECIECVKDIEITRMCIQAYSDNLLDDTWSIGRMVQEEYSDDLVVLRCLASNHPSEIDFWKIWIRAHWNKGEHTIGISISKDALIHHPTDEWLIDISTRGG